MASTTLLESAKLSQDLLVQGIIEDIIEVNQMFQMLPFDGIEGNALAYNRENVIGGAGVGGVGDAISAYTDTILGGNTSKDAATWDQISTSLTRILGDAEMDGLIQATRSNINDQKATQVASKAKNVGRQYQNMLINGTGASDQFTGLIPLAVAGQQVDTGTDGSALSFEILDEMIDLVKDKDGKVDYIIMHQRTRRAYKALLRALGGTSPDDIYTMPDGSQVIAYSGIPIFVNEHIPITQTKGATVGSTTTIFAGTFDDGSRKHGIAGLTASKESGIVVKEIGEKEDADESITRIKWYCGLALFSEKGLSSAPGVTN